MALPLTSFKHLKKEITPILPNSITEIHYVNRIKKKMLYGHLHS